MTNYDAAEPPLGRRGAARKIHRLADADVNPLGTLCGLTVTPTWSTFPEREATAENRCRRCWREAPEPTVDDVVEQLIADHVNRATDCYAHHMPGHGEYLLVRLGMKLARIEGMVASARDALAE